MSDDAVLDLKNFSWIVFGGGAIGLAVRKRHEAKLHIPDLYDMPIIDLQSILLGTSFVVMFLLSVVAAYAAYEISPWREAKRHWDICWPARIGKPLMVFLLVRSSLTFLGAVGIYFIFICFLIGAVTDGFGSGWFYIAIWFIGFYFLNFIQFKLMSFGVVSSSERFDFSVHISKLFNLPIREGGIVLSSLFAIFFLLVLNFDLISQSFGGGRPVEVRIFFKKNEGDNLHEISGSIVDVIWRRGSKVILRKICGNGDIFVVDQSQVEFFYILPLVDGEKMLCKRNGAESPQH